MAGKPKVVDAQVAAANEIYNVAREQADQEIAQMKENIQAVHECALKTGRAQAFRAMQLLAEFMEMKQLAQMVDNKDYLKIPGVSSIEDYFEQQGIKRRTGFNDLRIGRNLEADEVQLLALVGFTRRDLLGYASLPEEKRLEIKEGKVINLESASREEIRDLIEQVVVETRQAKEEAESTITAKDKVLKDKETVINKQARELARLGKEAEAKGLTADEDAFLQRMENLRTGFDGYMLKVEPDRIEELHDNSGTAVTPRMIVAYLTTLDYMRKQVLAAYDTAEMQFGSPAMCPEVLEDFEQFQTG